VEENSMKHLLSALMVGLAALLIAVPAITLAQTPSATPGAPGTPTTPGAPGAPITPGAPGARPATPDATVDTNAKMGTTTNPGSSSVTGSGSGSVSVPKAGTNLGGQASPAQPMTSDACKDGGWQKFGFKGQGECVGSFTKGGKR
jgi:hypothetical protein